MPHHLTSEGQGAPLQDGMPRHDHPCRWTNGLGILHYPCPEGKWQATSVLGPLWPQWGHLPWSSQDAHHGGSCSWVCTLLLLHQDGCPPWILVNHPQLGLQPAYDFQQSPQKILLPATSLWPCLFPRHLPEEDGSDPWKMPMMYQNRRGHHHTWPHQGRTWCLPMRSYAYCLQIWLGVQSTENTCKGSSHQFLWLPLQCQWSPSRPRKGRCCTCLTSTHKHHQTLRILRLSHIPKSLHPWSVHLDHPSLRAAQEGHRLHMELHLWQHFWAGQGSCYQGHHPQVLRPITSSDNTSQCLTGRPWCSTPAKLQTRSLCQQGPHWNWMLTCKHRERC